MYMEMCARTHMYTHTTHTCARTHTYPRGKLLAVAAFIFYNETNGY